MSMIPASPRDSVNNDSLQPLSFLPYRASWDPQLGGGVHYCLGLVDPNALSVKEIQTFLFPWFSFFFSLLLE